MNDNSLRNLFAELRRAETGSVPPFRVHPPRRVARLRYAFAAVVLLIVIAVAIVPHHSTPPQPSITAWRAPTDFLLQTPGRELLNTVPDLKGRTQ
jgi:hypothetical protein